MTSSTTPQPYTITVGTEIDVALRQHLQALLRAYNADVAGLGTPSPHPLTIRMTNPSGQLIGGLVAHTMWEWLIIDVLAVEPTMRGQGVGTRLMDQAEAIARERGCRRVHTSTYLHQAVHFYQQRGYDIIGQLDDYPDGYTLMWLRKEL